MSQHHDKTANAARGKWRGILMTLGLPEAFLTGKQGPCPMCDGSTRFRFDDKEGRGTWICNHCGAGSGMDLAMKFTGRSFPDAASAIDGIVGNLRPDAPTAQRDMTDDERRAALNALWRGASKAAPGDLLHEYLRSRGLPDEVPDCLRLATAVRDGEGGVRPCMVAMVTGPDGKAATLHRTFLRPDGKAKAEMAAPRKLMPGCISAGSAIRLGPQNRIMGIAEGIETALSASALFEMPVWAAINATMLVKWEPPSTTESVVVFGDADANFAGQSAAYALANRIRIEWPDVEVTVRIPDVVGWDWNDVLMKKARAA